MQVAVLDKDNILRDIINVAEAAYTTDKEKRTVALPEDHDVYNMIDQYFYNFNTNSFLPVLHLPEPKATLRSVGYDLNIVDALVMAVCDMIDGRKPVIPALLHSAMKTRRDELAQRLTDGSSS